MVKEYLRVIFHQFSFGAAIVQLLTRVARALMDPHCVPSYAQTGEDRIIESLLPNLASGFYVDIGCNHPVANSNTFKLYRRGWQGINVDANQDLVRKFEHIRPRDKNICAIVSDKVHSMEFNIYNDSLFSTVSHEQVNRLNKSRVPIRTETKKSKTLTDILDSNKAPLAFDLLTIDVEGHDFEVLSSLDLAKYNPQLIVIEMHGFQLDRPNESLIYRYLAQNNYKLTAYAIMNGYFMRAETGSTLEAQKSH